MKKNIDLKKSNYIVRESVSLQDVMEAITANHRGSAIVIDDERHVVGIITDGMIRRALLKGAVMQTPARQALNYNIVAIQSTDAKTLNNIEKFFSDNPAINIVPVVDDKNALIDILIRGGSYEGA
ncbi:MAG: CBS domain-containing protein [Patescibacteria group bacterium]